MGANRKKVKKKLVGAKKPNRISIGKTKQEPTRGLR